MQTTIRFTLPTLLCLSLLLVSGCGGKPVETDNQLRIATILGDFDGVKSLVAGGFDVNTKDGQGRTAIFDAIGTEDEDVALEIVKFLVSNGADVHVKDKEGMSLLDVARLHGKSEIEKYLESVGAKSGK